MLVCTVLVCTVLVCTVLVCTVLVCTVLECTVLECTCAVHRRSVWHSARTALCSSRASQHSHLAQNAMVSCRYILLDAACVVPRAAIRLGSVGKVAVAEIVLVDHDDQSARAARRHVYGGGD